MNIFAPLAWYDRLAAKVLVPLAIRLCQLFRVTQYQLHDYLWLLFYWTLIYVLAQVHAGWFPMTVAGYFALFWTIRVGLQKYTTPTVAHTWPGGATVQRRILLLLETYHSGVHILYALGLLGPAWAANASFDASCPMIWYALIADYAITIRNLPPREEKEPKRQVVHQHN